MRTRSVKRVTISFFSLSLSLLVVALLYLGELVKALMFLSALKLILFSVNALIS